MNPLEFLYNIGERAEVLSKRIMEIIKPFPNEKPSAFRVTRHLMREGLSIHELLSLNLQMTFVVYLILNLLIILIGLKWYWLLGIYIIYLLYTRLIIVKNWEFFVDPEPYRFFYYTISFLSLLAFLGYSLLRELSPGIYYYYGYIVAVALTVFLFRHYFKSKYGRDYTYGIVEEIKGGLVRVFIHDDIAANIKPGFYWLPAVEEAEPGRVVKVLAEDRTFRSARPVRILEVYLGQSSQSSTEPKEETE
ncbi:DUF2101 domain-containing protein [Thermococcus indicus]|uniref:DUF2101 domain-containing protein n=1 Tax=Thermococcus indicus TaxID=2586643 RepID=A0A4Y5SKU2_9EURY|nr:DUF2101 family protein [Thermococcus indicus]QDA30671.1 DUF2101 domain-containing protein [Thermococcus indicus]